MRTATKFKLAYVALSAVDTWLSGAGPKAEKARVVTKPLLMPTLAASFATNPDARNSPLFASTLTAQMFGWGGDLGLMGNGSKPFVAGAGSFGIGHLAYVAGFRRVRRERALLDSPTAKAVLGSGVVLGGVLGAVASRKDPVFGVAVPTYSILLTSMTAHSVHISPAQPRSVRWLTLAGGMSFLASDTILGLRKFVVRQPAPEWMERAVMATYTGAQLLLAEGAARAR